MKAPSVRPGVPKLGGAEPKPVQAHVEASAVDAPKAAPPGAAPPNSDEPWVVDAVVGTGRGLLPNSEVVPGAPNSEPLVVRKAGAGDEAGGAGEAPNPNEEADGVAGEAPKPDKEADGVAGEAPKPNEEADGVAGEAPKPNEEADGVAGEAPEPNEEADGGAGEAPKPNEEADGVAGEAPKPDEEVDGGADVVEEEAEEVPKLNPDDEAAVVVDRPKPNPAVDAAGVEYGEPPKLNPDVEMDGVAEGASEGVDVDGGAGVEEEEAEELPKLNPDDEAAVVVGPKFNEVGAACGAAFAGLELTVFETGPKENDVEPAGGVGEEVGVAGVADEGACLDMSRRAIANKPTCVCKEEG